jgi:ribosomal protein L16 Arg81 hydroxylase
MMFERETTPLLSVRLAPGDWLYIPPGWWHEARAESDAITLAVGMMSPAAIELLDFLRKELAALLPWRQRLPVSTHGTPEERVERTRAIFAELGKDLARVLADPETARAFLEASSRPPPTPGQTRSARS